MPDFDSLLKNEPGWAWLKSRGWTIKPVSFSVGTARANHYKKCIEMKPSEYRKPSRRTIRYVLPHEVAHGVHYELSTYRCDELRNNRKLTWSAAIETVAERWCVQRDNSKWMHATVKASCIWHGRLKRGKYGWGDVMSNEALTVVTSLQTEINNV